MVVFLTCANCGEEFAELVHLEYFNKHGVLIFELLDKELLDKYPPETVGEFEDARL
jgi:hypothetical protein